MSVLIIKGDSLNHDRSVLLTGGEVFTWWSSSNFQGWGSGVGANFTGVSMEKKEILGMGLLDVQELW